MVTQEQQWTQIGVTKIIIWHYQKAQKCKKSLMPFIIIAIIDLF